MTGYLLQFGSENVIDLVNIDLGLYLFKYLFMLF